MHFIPFENKKNDLGLLQSKKGVQILKKITLSLMVISCISYGQNIIYGEALGPGILGSINYERMLGEKLSVRVGYGGFSATDDYDETTKVTAIPIGVNYLMGNNHKLEIGGGANLLNFSQSIDLLGLSLETGLTTFYGGLGYRYQKDTGGLIFRLKGYYLMLGDAGGVPTVGASLGWAF